MRNYQRNALVIGVVVAAIAFFSFVVGETDKLIWQMDPVGLVIVPGLLGAAFDGVIVYVIAYLAGRLLARRYQ